MDFKNTFHSIIIGPPKHMVVTMHKRPDGDALGSSLALAKVLRFYGHTVKVVSPTIYPQFLSWMPGIDEVVIAERTTKKFISDIVTQADFIFCLDFAEYHRLGDIADIVRTSQALKIVIDHHPIAGEKITSMLLCLPNVSATAVILYDLLMELHMMQAIDLNVAICLYVGVATDTGFFCNANTNSDVHTMVAQLLALGVNANHIYHELTGNMSLRRLKFIAHAIQNRLVIVPKCHLGYFAITREDMKQFKLQSGDTGGLITYALNVRNVYVAGLLTEQKDNSVHISLRSFGDFPVNKLAEIYFKGGGHTNAAGAISHDSLEDTCQQLILATTAFWKNYK